MRRSCAGQGIPLNLGKVQDFGGVHQLMAHFKTAASDESARNLLCVVLDCLVVQYMQVSCPSMLLPLLKRRTVSNCFSHSYRLQ